MENPPITDTARELDAVRKELDASRAEARRLAELLAEAARSKTIAEDERQERFRELARMAELVMHKDQALTRAAELKDWLQRLNVHLMERPSWWGLLPVKRRRRRERMALRRERIFDAQAYLAIHADVKDSGADALRHYLEHGMDEGRARSAPRGR